MIFIFSIFRFLVAECGIPSGTILFANCKAPMQYRTDDFCGHVLLVWNIRVQQRSLIYVLFRKPHPSLLALLKQRSLNYVLFIL